MGLYLNWATTVRFKIFSHSLFTNHSTASYQRVPGARSPRVKRLGLEAKRSPPSSSAPGQEW
jgi:hypothetical protein